MTQLITKIADVRAARQRMSGRVALVMTMGALHDGHRMLVRRAREIADHVIVSDFVNPLQFGPNEDYDRYPRDIEGDLRMVEGLADVLFAPSVEEMYPVYPPPVTVSAGRMGTVLEGAARPGHFDGVVTIVAKVINLVQPDVAVFGRKDAQQLAIIEQMVSDLHLPVQIEAVDIQREDSGLARSSRNAYLSDDGRERAVELSRTVRALHEADPSLGALREVVRNALQRAAVEWNYLHLLDPRTLEVVDAGYRGEILAVMSAQVDGVRLLDATVVEVTEA